MTLTKFERASTNRVLSAGVISAIAPTALAQVQAVGHPTATFLRAVVSVTFNVTIGTGGTPPPVIWTAEVFPLITVQVDSGGFPPTYADPGTVDSRIVHRAPMVKRVYPSPVTGQSYFVNWELEGQINTNSMRKGTGSGTNYPTVTVLLWTGDQDNYLGSSFYDHRSIDWQCNLLAIFGY